MIPTTPLSLQELTREIMPLADILQDPRAPVNTPIEYAHAFRSLYTLLLDDRHWTAIHETKDGSRSNHFRHNVGVKRMEWLESFYKNEVLKE